MRVHTKVETHALHKIEEVKIGYIQFKQMGTQILLDNETKLYILVPIAF